MKARLVLALLILTVAACKKTGTGSSNKPVITLIDVKPTSVQASSPKDTVFINFKVSDGDGDLGNDPSSGNHDIYLVDTRVNQANPYYFPSIPYDDVNAKDGITAFCTVKVVAALFLQKRTDAMHVNSDTLQYKIYVKDRAGNNSDTITTPPIYLF